LYVTVLRTFLLYLLVIFAMRVMGKRQLGELQPAELVITILISNIATLPIEDLSIPLLCGVVPILSLVCFEVFVSTLTLKRRSLRKLVSGNPMIIIHNGVIDQQMLVDLRFSVDDLMEQLRTKDIFDIRDVAFAVVETTGKLSVYPKAPKRTVTAEQMRIPTAPEDDMPPVVVISDGELELPSLQRYQIPLPWVETVVHEHGYTVEKILLMTCTPTLDYHLIPASEQLHPQRRRKKEVSF